MASSVTPKYIQDSHRVFFQDDERQRSKEEARYANGPTQEDYVTLAGRHEVEMQTHFERRVVVELRLNTNVPNLLPFMNSKQWSLAAAVTGGAAGATLGALVGAPACGVGAVPGAVVGGIVGFVVCGFTIYIASETYQKSKYREWSHKIKVQVLQEFVGLFDNDDEMSVFWCPIAKTIMLMPVILPCKHSFELSQIQAHAKTKDTCPECRNRFSIGDIRFNNELYEKIYRNVGLILLNLKPKLSQAQREGLNLLKKDIEEITGDLVQESVKNALKMAEKEEITYEEAYKGLASMFKTAGEIQKVKKELEGKSVV